MTFTVQTNSDSLSLNSQFDGLVFSPAKSSRIQLNRWHNRQILLKDSIYENLTRLNVTYDYVGNWTTNQSPLLDFFNLQEGLIVVTVVNSSLNSSNVDFFITLYDGQYQDRKLVIFNISNISVSEPNIVKTLDTVLRIQYYSKFAKIDAKRQNLKAQCEVNVNWQFLIPEPSYSNNINFNISLNSQNCTFNFQALTKIDNDDDTTKALLYSLLATSIAIIQTYSTLKLIRKVTEDERENIKISLITVTLYTVWDAFLCLFNLYLAFVIRVFFQFFIIPFFFYFILTAIFEMRLLMIVWKGRYFSTYQTMNDLRRGILLFYLKFYICLIVFLMTLFNNYMESVLLIPAFLYLLPQIIHQALRGQRFKFDFNLILGMALPRLLIPLYFRACPNNIVRFTPDKNNNIILPSLLAFQIIILFLQSKLGSRFFIPAIFLPPKYSYYKKEEFSINSFSEEDNCPICFCPLYSEPPRDNINESVKLSMDNQQIQEENNSDTKNKPLVKKVVCKIMVTPCNHKYHIDCLQSWMNIKLECPSCRTKLPPLD